MHLRGFPTVPGARSVLGYVMKLWRIRSLTTTSPDPELLSGSSKVAPRPRPSSQAVFRGQLHPVKVSVGMGFLSILEGPHTFVSKLQRRPPPSHFLPTQACRAQHRGSGGGEGSEGKGWPECRRQLHREGESSSFCPCPQSCRSSLG